MLIEIVTGLRSAPGREFALGLAASVLDTVGSRALPLELARGRLAALCRLTRSPIPYRSIVTGLKVCRVRLDPVLLRQIRPYRGN